MNNVSKGLRHFVPLVLSLLTVAFLGGCDLNTRMSTFDTKGPIAEEQLKLFMVTVWVSTFIFIIVGGVFLVAVIKFREKKNDDRPLPSQGHGNPLVEIGLIGASILLLVIVAVPTLKGIWFTHDLPTDPAGHIGTWYPGDDVAAEEADKLLKIRVVGYQWWWAFEYPQLGITTANELILPAGRPVQIELRSMDVIHSFWLPRIAGKVDLIPGRINGMWIQAGETLADWTEQTGPAGSELEIQNAYAQYLKDEIEGYYYGQCAEYCGDSHARMLFRSTVVDDNEFADWVSEIKAGHAAPEGMAWDAWYDTLDNNPDTLTGDINEGLKLFVGRGACIGCHTVQGNPRALGVTGPDLTKVGSRLAIAAGWLDHRAEDGSVDTELQLKNFIKWIKETDVVKPGNLMWDDHKGGGIGNLSEPLTDDEIRKISLYLQTLK